MAILFASVIYFITASILEIDKTNDEGKNVRSAISLVILQDSIKNELVLLDSAKERFLRTGNAQYLSAFYAYKTNIRKNAQQLLATNLNSKKLLVQKEQLNNKINYLLTNTSNIMNHRLKNPTDSLAIHQMLYLSAVHRSGLNELMEDLDSQSKKYLFDSNFNKKSNVYRLLRLFIVTFLLISIILFIYYRKIILAFKTQKLSDNILRYNASLIGNISDPIITTNHKFEITNWNKFAEELYGYTEEEVLNKKFAVALPTVQQEMYYAQNFLLNSESSHWQNEFVFNHKDGHQVYSQISASAISDFDGKIIGTVAVIRNITQHKILQHQLQNLTNNLQNQVNEKVSELSGIFERITDAFFALDNNWNYTYINEKAASLHNRKAEDLIGKNIWEEYPEIVGEPFEYALRKAKDTLQSQNVELHYSKTNQWFQDLIYPSHNGLSVYYHEITDKKISELAVLEVNQKLRFHINNTPLAVIEFDVNMNILQWSQKAEEIFGWEAAEVKQRNLFDLNLIFEEDIEIVKNILAAIPQAVENSHTLHYRCVRKMGGIIYCEWYNSLLRDKDHKVFGIMSLIQDVTARKTVELELLEAESKFRSLVEKSMVGVYIIQGRKIIYTNPRHNQIFGYEVDEKIGNIFNLVYEPDKQMVRNNIRERIEGSVESMQYTFRAIHKKGHIIYVEVFGTKTIFKGQPAIIGTLIDVTVSRKLLRQTLESEEALKISNERFEMVTRATNEAIMDWKLNEKTIWGNEAFQNLFSQAEKTPFSFKRFLENVHPADQPIINKVFADALAKKETAISATFRFRHLPESYLVLEINTYLVFDAADKLYRLIGAIRNITEQRNYQQKIELEKNLSDNIINSLPGVFYLFNKNGKYFRWNKNLEQITGRTSEEIKNNTPLIFFKPEDHAYVQNKIFEVFLNGTSELEANLLTKDGHTIPYYFNGTQIDYEGETCLVGCGIDVSERVKSQEKLKESEEKFRSLVEQAADGIYTTDGQGNLTNVNSSMSTLTGYSDTELLQMNILTLLSEPYFNETHNFDSSELLVFEARKKDGTEIIIEISSKKLFDGTYQGIIRDITERKKVEEELHNAAKKYRLLFNENPMPMFMLDFPKENFIDVNQAAISFYGYSKTEFLHMNIADLSPKMVADKSHDPKASHWVHTKKDQSLASLNIISHHIIFEGKPVKLILAQDISQTKLAENKLKSSHEQLRQLAMHMEKLREAERTHMAREIHDELGQQLTGLKMDISWLNKKIQVEDEAINEKLKDTISLIDKTVVTVRKIATDLRPSILDDLGLVAAMEWQSDEFQKRAEVSTHFSSNVSQINLPAELSTGLFRIYQESLTNILRHANATEVNAMLQLLDNNLKLVINDNGKGFTMETIGSKKTLGLLGMQERITLLGGSYDINSSPGNGTTITIELPLPE